MVRLSIIVREIRINQSARKITQGHVGKFQANHPGGSYYLRKTLQKGGLPTNGITELVKSSHLERLIPPTWQTAMVHFPPRKWVHS